MTVDKLAKHVFDLQHGLLDFAQVSGSNHDTDRYDFRRKSFEFIRVHEEVVTQLSRDPLKLLQSLFAWLSENRGYLGLTPGGVIVTHASQTHFIC